MQYIYRKSNQQDSKGLKNTRSQIMDEILRVATLWIIPVHPKWKSEIIIPC